MYHSITFFREFSEINPASDDDVVSGGINTWDDWHLIPTTRPVINPPNVRTNEVIIPGRSGSLDLSEVLTGYPLYDNRTGSIEFVVANDYWDWAVAYSTIMRCLHGKTFKMMLEDDPAYYYEGRFSVNSWKSDKNWSTITIDYDVQPYKVSRQSTNEDWLWDPFSFEDGLAYDTEDITAEISNELDLYTNCEADTYSMYIGDPAYNRIRYCDDDIRVINPYIHAVDKTFIIYGKDDHSTLRIDVTDFIANQVSVHLPCFVYVSTSSISSIATYYIGDALYTFKPVISIAISIYNSIFDYENQNEPIAIYNTEILDNGSYEEPLWQIPETGVAKIHVELLWKWKRTATRIALDAHSNIEEYLSQYVYSYAHYEPSDNPIWLNPERPFGTNPYDDPNTRSLYDYPTYVIDEIGEDHSIKASATLSIYYRGGVL